MSPNESHQDDTEPTILLKHSAVAVSASLGVRESDRDGSYPEELRQLDKNFSVRLETPFSPSRSV